LRSWPRTLLPTLQASVERREMVEETREERTLEALKLIAAELERLRLLREYELGVRVVDNDGSLHVAQK